MRNKVISHLKGDIKTFKHEAKEDRELIKDLKGKKMKHEDYREEKTEERLFPGIHKKIKAMAKKDGLTHKLKAKHHSKKHHSKGKGKTKVEKVMHEFKHGTLKSGSAKGPKVTNPKQAIAIALSEARKSGAKIPKKRK